MPLFYQHTINESSKLGIWKIEEAEAFFLRKVSVQREISHPHKRLQHLAGRYLLQQLFDDFPYELIMIADTRKPFLANEAYHFSISHCGDFAAAIVSRSARVGVDVELVKPGIQKIRHKFLSEQELKLLPVQTTDMADEDQEKTMAINDSPSPYFLTLCWSAKEAMYKWYGAGGVDFKGNMQLVKPIDFYHDAFIQSFYQFNKGEQVGLTVMSENFGELVMSFIIS